MKRSRLGWSFWVGIVLFAFLLGAKDCRREKKPAAVDYEVTQKALTSVFSGYEQTVTVKASPEQVKDYFANQGNLAVKGVEIKPPKQASSATEIALGFNFPLNVSRQGIKIAGRMITVKSDENNLWLVWDNDQMLQIQRWTFEKVREGTRVTCKVENETPKMAVGPLKELFDAMAPQIQKEIDLMLANLQAKYDPTVDPKKLVAVGLRGESYEKIFQVNEASIWIDATPQQVNDYLNDPKNYSGVMQEVEVGEEVSGQYAKAPIGSVLYSPAIYHAGPIKVNADIFAVKRADGSRRIYAVIFNTIWQIDTQVKPENKGTRFGGRLLYEIPDYLALGNSDFAIQVMGMSKAYRERMIAVKRAVEAGK